MSRKQWTRYEVLSKANDGYITNREASEALGITERQVRRLKKKVREEGASGLVHKNSFRSPANKLPGEMREAILLLRKRPEYARSNFSHFRELLLEHHGIEISYPSLYGILKSRGFKSPKTKRRFKPHRRRKRQSQAGLLLQVDATPFAWFKGDRKRYALHGAIDDATGQVAALYMCRNECLHGYFEMFKLVAENFGIPVSVYADRHTIFQSPNNAKAEVDHRVQRNDTQLGRALKELGATVIAARSPQAKGRVERLWGTLQSRLPVEFAIHRINTVEAANEFLESYVFGFNSVFAVDPEKRGNLFKKPRASINLDYVFCIKEPRIVDAGGVFSYGGKTFKVVDSENHAYVPPRAQINVLVSPAFGIKAEYRKTVFETLPFVPPKRKKTTSETSADTRRMVPDGHHYRYSQMFSPKLAFAENGDEVIEILEEVLLK